MERHVHCLHATVWEYKVLCISAVGITAASLLLLSSSELSIEILCCDSVWSTRPHSAGNKDGDDNKIQFRVISLHDENKDFYGGKKDFGSYDIDSVDFHSGCNFWYVSTVAKHVCREINQKGHRHLYDDVETWPLFCFYHSLVHLECSKGNSNIIIISLKYTLLIKSSTMYQIHGSQKS